MGTEIGSSGIRRVSTGAGGPTRSSGSGFPEVRARPVRPEAPPLRPCARSGCHPCSFEQLGLLHARRRGTLPEGPEISGAWRLRGELDIEGLEAALNEIRERHRILRTSFRMRSGEPVQVVDPMVSLPLEVIDVEDLPIYRQADSLRSVVSFELERSRPVRNGHPVRWKLLRCSDQKHVLLFTAHRSVFDRRSLALFLRELEGRYGPGDEGGKSSGPARRLQYRDYAHWQRTWLGDDAVREISEWWKPRIDDARTRIDLPSAGPSPNGGRSHRAWAREWLTPELRRRVLHLAKESRTDAGELYLAAFVGTVHRYTNQKEITVGVPRDGRTVDSLKDLIGPFEDLLLLRTDLSGDPTFRELVRRIRTDSANARERGSLPVRSVLREDRGAADGAGDPYPQLFFSHERSRPRPPRLQGLEVTDVDVEVPARGWDLELVVEDEGSDPHLALGSPIQRFDRMPTTRMLRHVRHLLREAMDDPDRPLSRLSVLDEPERRKVLVDWARHHRHSSSSPNLLHEMVRRRMDRDDHPAVVEAAGETASAPGVLKRADAIARSLRARGVGPGDRVGLCVDRSVDAIAAVLGILEAGAAYLPLEPHGPPWTNCHVSSTLSAKLVLSTSSTEESLPRGADVDVLPVERLAAEGSSDPAASNGNGISGNGEAPARPVRDSDPAIVFCHWGPGGQMQTRIVRHRSATSFIRSMVDVPGLPPGDRFLAVTPFWSDHSILEIFLPLISGATLHLAPDDEIGRPDRILRRVEEEDISALHATADAWRSLLYAGWNGRKGVRGFCVGDALDAKLAGTLVERLDTVCTLYSTPGSAVWPLRHLLEPDDLSDDSVPLGRPVASGRAYVLDAHGEPVPMGVPGELWVRGGEGEGDERMHGASGNGSSSPMQDPFAADGAWIHRAGHRARWRRDGAVVWEP